MYARSRWWLQWAEVRSEPNGPPGRTDDGPDPGMEAPGKLDEVAQAKAREDRLEVVRVRMLEAKGLEGACGG